MYTGPHIIKDGLVFGYDTGYGIADNVTGTRFYPGKPGTNLVTGQATAFSNWSGLTGTSTYYTTAEGNQGVHLITTSGGGVQFYSSPTITGISASTQYTISATIKYSGTTPHPNLFYVRQYHNGSQITEGGHFSTGIMVDLGNGWYRAYRTFTTTSTTSYINLQGYQYSSGVNLKIQDLQFELGGLLTPYNGVNGTRSSTASLIDLKETTDIDLSNVSFDSTGQPTFDGTSDYISKTRRQYTTEPWSVEIIFKPTDASDTSWNGLFGGYIGAGGYWFFHSAGNLALYSSAGYLSYRSWTKANTFTVDEFHHLVITYTPATSTTGTFNLYYNGGEKTDSFSFTFANSYTLDSQFIGMGSGNRFGTNDVAVYKEFEKALSATEVKQNFNAYKNRFSI